MTSDQGDASGWDGTVRVVHLDMGGGWAGQVPTYGNVPGFGRAGGQALHDSPLMDRCEGVAGWVNDGMNSAYTAEDIATIVKWCMGIGPNKVQIREKLVDITSTPTVGSGPADR